MKYNKIPNEFRMARRSFAQFERIRACYARPGVGHWSSFRLFYLRAAEVAEAGLDKLTSETIRETRTVYRVIERHIPGTRRMTERFSHTRTRFVERLIAKTGRLISKEVSPVTGSTELVYVLGTPNDTAPLSRAATEVVATTNRVNELNVLYGQRKTTRFGETTVNIPRKTIGDSQRVTPLVGKNRSYGGETKSVSRLFAARVAPVSANKEQKLREQFYAVSGLFHTSGFSSATTTSSGSVIGTEYPELVYGRSEILSRSANSNTTDVPQAPDSNATEISSQVSSKTPSNHDEKRTDETTVIDYREITVNLDFDYLSNRLFKMLENAERTEMERRGLI